MCRRLKAWIYVDVDVDAHAPYRTRQPGNIVHCEPAGLVNPMLNKFVAVVLLQCRFSQRNLNVRHQSVHQSHCQSVSQLISFFAHCHTLPFMGAICWSVWQPHKSLEITKNNNNNNNRYVYQQYTYMWVYGTRQYNKLRTNMNTEQQTQLKVSTTFSNRT